MCCPFSSPSPRLENIHVVKNHDNKIQFIGIINFSPKNFIETLLRFFQRLELAESYVEICDGAFDLFGKLFQTYVNQHVLNALHLWHESAHALEGLLHAACFFNDLTRIFSGRFVEYHNKQKTRIDVIRTIARVLLAASNFVATVSLSTRLFTGNISVLAPLQFTLSMMGYALLTISTLWRKFQHAKKHHFNSDLCIYTTGFVHDVITVGKNVSVIKPFMSTLKIVRSAAHVLHGYAKQIRLIPPDHIKIEGNLMIPAGC